MKSSRTVLLLTALFLIVPHISQAAITFVADDAICDAISFTMPGGGSADIPIPSDVPLVSFYAQGGKGGDGKTKNFDITGGGGGGGACAYFLSSPGVYTYLLCVGGGGGGISGGYLGGLGGSTAATSTGVGFGGDAAGSNSRTSGHPGILNGYGGSGGDNGGKDSSGNYFKSYGGAGGAPSHGGYVTNGNFEFYSDGMAAGGAGAGGDIFSTAGNGASYKTLTPGGTYLGGGWGSDDGGGGARLPCTSSSLLPRPTSVPDMSTP